MRSGAIYLPHGRRYADPETVLIPRAAWPPLRAAVCQPLELDPTGTQRLTSRAQELRELLPRGDRTLDRSEGLRGENGELSGPGDEAADLPESVQALEEQLSHHSPQVDLTELLLAVDPWTGFSHPFTPASGSQPRTQDLLPPRYATLLAQGTNRGLRELAHRAPLTSERLAWASTWSLREETRKTAVAD